MRPGRFQKWPDLGSVYTGTRIIPMVVTKEIPRFLYVGKFCVKVWYRGQPITCDVCHAKGYKATDCPSKGKCFVCSCALSCGSLHSCGCVVLFRPSLSLVNSWGDDVGRYLHCEFVFCGKSFRVCCIYAPNRNPARDQFFDNLQTKVDPSVPTILCGDFNAVFDRSLDHLGSDPSDLSREFFLSPGSF